MRRRRCARKHEGFRLALLPFQLHDYPITLTICCYHLVLRGDLLHRPLRSAETGAPEKPVALWPQAGRHRCHCPPAGHRAGLRRFLRWFLAAALCRRRHDELLHHLHRDFPGEVQVHPRAADLFRHRARRRRLQIQDDLLRQFAEHRVLDRRLSLCLRRFRALPLFRAVMFCPTAARPSGSW